MTRRGAAADRPDTPPAAAAVAVLLAAHAALVLWGGLVLSAGGWRRSSTTVAAELAATLGFWVVGLVLTARAWRPYRPGASALGLLLGDLPARASAIRQAAVGLIGGAVFSVVVVPIVYAPLHRWWGTSPEELERPARELVDRAIGPGAVVCLVVLTCIGAPLVEEVLYRGLLLPALMPVGSGFAVVLSAGVFGLAHLQALQLVGLVALGVLLGVLRVRTGALVAPIAAHVAFNAATVVMLLAQR